MLELVPGQHVHFIGIGGAGLSAIARVLLERGFKISGSDLKTSDVTAALAADGARIWQGHDASCPDGADWVVASSAVAPEHIEVQAAIAQGIPVYRRRDMIESLMRGQDSIAVAGTHGKTTTTSMIVHILQQAGKNPSYIVGGTMGNTGKNAAVGKGASFVIEADEYDNMFHGLRPDLAVVTNVEHDHPDFFKTPQQVSAAYAKFVDLLPATGLLVACADDGGAAALLDERRRAGLPAVSYGITNPAADWQAANLCHIEGKAIFTVWRDGIRLDEVELTVPGAHNVLNALAALAVAEERGASFEPAAKALGSFKNTARRFEIRGVRDDVIVVDDYAHHPTEIKASLCAAALAYPKREIWAVWQPHTYSRIRQFMDGFLKAFADADHVLITPVFAAREAADAEISSRRLAAAMQSHSDVRYAPSLDDAVLQLREGITPPALMLVFSAGDANRIADDYLNHDEPAP